MKKQNASLDVKTADTTAAHDAADAATVTRTAKPGKAAAMGKAAATKSPAPKTTKAARAKSEKASAGTTQEKAPTAAKTQKRTAGSKAAKPSVKTEKTSPGAKSEKATVKAAKPARARTAKPKPAVADARPAASAVATPVAGAQAAWAEKPWLKTYPSVVPAEIGPLGASSIGDMLVSACKQYAGRPAFTSMGRSMSYAEIERHSAHFAAFLQSKGLAKGARVALMMPNLLQYPVALMAVLKAGYTVVNVNPLYTQRELEHQLKDSGAEAIVILENFAHTLQAVIQNTKVKHVVVASMGDMLGVKGLIVNLVVRRVKKMVRAWSLPGHVKFPAALKAGSSQSFKPVKVGPDDIAFLQYTGGTTGVSKGAMLLHRNVLADVAQMQAWLGSAFVNRSRVSRLVFACPLPLYHIYALTVNLLTGMQIGAQNILIPNPRDIPAMVKEIRGHQVNVFPGLNTLFNALLNNEEFRKLDFKPLLLTFGGGMAVQRSVAERWQKLTRCIISEGYGLSETSPVATANRFDAETFTGTIGLPLPSTEVAIRDDEGRDLPLGEVGEICIRGPQVMAGYWNRPDETAQVMSSDGFFRTGDMGFMDENGYVKIVDRKKDMILVSGFNVYPNELEEIVAQHSGVLEVAAVGVPDEHSGEVPKLFVVKKDPKLTEEDLLKFCKENFTGYKRPRHIEFRTELPKSNVGKILRRELRE